MRLDKFLKVSRIIKRRTVANDACDAEHVTVNGKRAKASYDVKEGDVIEITFGQRTLKVRVLNVKEFRKETGMSQAKFAEHFGIPLRTLQEWEQERRTPPSYLLNLLKRIWKSETTSQ